MDFLPFLLLLLQAEYLLLITFLLILLTFFYINSHSPQFILNLHYFDSIPCNQ